MVLKVLLKTKQKKESDNINFESKSDAQIVEILKNQINTLNNQIENKKVVMKQQLNFTEKSCKKDQNCLRISKFWH